MLNVQMINVIGLAAFDRADDSNLLAWMLMYIESVLERISVLEAKLSVAASPGRLCFKGYPARISPSSTMSIAHSNANRCHTSRWPAPASPMALLKARLPQKKERINVAVFSGSGISLKTI
jgi:hypothetical protein